MNNKNDTGTADNPQQKMETFHTIGLFALTLLLAGCASLSPEQCLHADWRQIGYTDGVRGLSGAQIDEHARACAPQGIRPNLDAYLAGRAQGLTSYCQPQNGFELGRRGVAQIIGDCPENLKWAFQDQYNQGRQIYLIESELGSRRNQLNNLHKKLHHINKRIDEIKSELPKKDLSSDRRNTLLNEFDHLVNQKEKLIPESLELETHVDHLQKRQYRKLQEFGR